ncbi:hypothetical protein F07S3_40930 [Bradyrhizobium diazoefficiens]|uniref:Uncharacterized protein n=1 Tax=Bradyrhizobium diazoefficiens TaxID=1355477 RepID=A0A809YI75_9BRAD|nr:hypothetical protein F07S3_40930 [Bradyrhizobium diazoefficiens]BCA12011.1 hypothetical protein BDHF08_38580 [Bradyrhizobium diazoefficiens]BCE30054.1 hypothetical protein XF2B_38230 [Bradyrhizobium diazoefficiens]BCE38795.1 hypothetical protein XF3B_38260 [Bradyrhizobium diazoefficiens]BCE47487.1 hypothetical protein XF4B_38360 [Bradyrhizobium diazoefficiens]
MREIDDAEHAEDDRQADRDQNVEKAEHKAIDGLRQDHVEHGVIRFRIWAARWRKRICPRHRVSPGVKPQSVSILQALSPAEPKALAMSSGVFGNSALTSK